MKFNFTDLLTDHVSQERLARLISALAEIGKSDGDGVNRQALTPQDVAARKFLAEVAAGCGCEVYRDEAANVFFRRAGTTDGPPVVTGSHIDSQPTGGKFDGAYGVCAGLEMMAALNDAGVVTELPLEVAIWTNEEGCRFAPGSMGSAAFVQPELLSTFRESADSTGLRFGEALDDAANALQFIPLLPLNRPFSAFVEAHIEQGPVLEREGKTLGVVSGIQGVRWFRISVRGQTSHAGTTPREFRKDAVLVATELVQQAYAAANESDADLRLTVGRFEVSPGATNTIADGVTFTIDLRHPSDDVLDDFEARFRSWTRRQSACSISLEELMRHKPTPFSEKVRATVAEAAEQCGEPWRELLSGAFHDSMYLAEHCPTGMLFIPSKDGLSHHPAELSAPDELAWGAKALTLAMYRLANPSLDVAGQ
ncbi:Amidase, hydantoinase/carbamoylase [Paraburkholderia piptadeniae]|uniref:Amidase, hydantoinase/carbamoylase n=1 Tax=Paraburkholderia piptadeniae TaxID=1701573 RepID=A0A1N7RW32_9BURK|nr:M20 family metallo-hydrolase [Paraburkholderia piptadeniae]SIT39310.1 Amidase, hydantoinase/carbamoylase [Paraburkholderia piptadeniae]